MRRSLRRRTRGFTLIEVMMAVGIMTIGAVAIMGMIKASTHGNAQARALTNATQNTQLWIDRLHRVSLGWTQSTQTSVAALPYLAGLSNANTLTWFVPGGADGADGISGLDWQGTPTGASTARFCTLLRLSWITVGQSIRADVLTYFARNSTDPATGGSGAFTCTAGGDGTAIVAELDTDHARLSSVRASTVLRWSPQ